MDHLTNEVGVGGDIPFTNEVGVGGDLPFSLHMNDIGVGDELLLNPQDSSAPLDFSPRLSSHSLHFPSSPSVSRVAPDPVLAYSRSSGSWESCSVTQFASSSLQSAIEAMVPSSGGDGVEFIVVARRKAASSTVSSAVQPKQYCYCSRGFSHVLSNLVLAVALEPDASRMPMLIHDSLSAVSSSSVSSLSSSSSSASAVSSATSSLPVAPPTSVQMISAITESMRLKYCAYAGSSSRFFPFLSLLFHFIFRFPIVFCRKIVRACSLFAATA